MIKRHVSVLVAAVMAVTGAAASFTPAQASMMPPVAAAISAANPTAGVVEVRHQRRWRHRGYRGSRYHGRRYHHGSRYYRNYGSYRNYGYRHYNRGYYYRDYDNDFAGAAVVAGIVGLAAGALIAGQNYGGSSYHSICARKYRSYDPYSGTYLGYDGYRHRCRY